MSWKTIATSELAHGGTTATCWISKRGNRWQCLVSRPFETEGRGDSAEEAVEACRKDVLAQAADETIRAKAATMLREALYAVEDYENEETISEDR